MSKTTSKKFNPDVIIELQNADINVNDGLAYLLTLYYGIPTTIFPMMLKNKIDACGIFIEGIIDTGSSWKIPLFVDDNYSNFEWVNDYRNLFKQYNPERTGSKQIVLARMKKLFSQYPHIRKDDVMEATSLYLKSQSNGRYITTAERFLYKDREGSPILDWIEKAAEIKAVKTHKNNIDII